MLLFINIGYARHKPKSHIKRQQHPVDRAPDFNLYQQFLRIQGSCETFSKVKVVEGGGSD